MAEEWRGSTTPPPLSHSICPLTHTLTHSSPILSDECSVSHSTPVHSSAHAAHTSRCARAPPAHDLPSNTPPPPPPPPPSPPPPPPSPPTTSSPPLTPPQPPLPPLLPLLLPPHPHPPLPPPHPPLAPAHLPLPHSPSSPASPPHLTVLPWSPATPPFIPPLIPSLLSTPPPSPPPPSSSTIPCQLCLPRSILRPALPSPALGSIDAQSALLFFPVLSSPVSCPSFPLSAHNSSSTPSPRHCPAQRSLPCLGVCAYPHRSACGK